MSFETEPPLPLKLNENEDAVAGQKIGYARVSSRGQNLERQLAQLKEKKVFICFTDEKSGSTRDRPGLQQALNYVRAGDQLIFTSFDRCARSVTDLYSIIEELVEKGVEVKFLKEGQTYSQKSSPLSKLMLGVLGSVVEFEREMILDRQAEGIARAKERGVYKGRPGSLNKEQLQEVRYLVDLGVPKAEVARRFGVSKTTIWRATQDDYTPGRTRKTASERARRR